ncbi:MAG: sugar phosphate isomerase/epimerase family protein [Chloroflexota bacterium]
MKKAINRWCFPADWPVRRCLEWAAKAGFQGLEFNVAEEGELNLETRAEKWRGLAQEAHDLGLALPSVSTALHWKYPLTASDEITRTKGWGIVRRMIETARALGADTVLVVPGLVTPEVDYETAYKRSQEALVSLSETAGSHQIVIGVENVWNRFLLSPLEFKRFIDETRSPWVKAYFDVGNVLATGYPEQWIRILSGRIVKVHVKDFSTRVGNIAGFVPLLAGDVDWPAVMAALRAVGYDGWLTAELAPYRYHPELLIYQTSHSLEAIIGAEADT